MVGVVKRVYLQTIQKLLRQGFDANELPGAKLIGGGVSCDAYKVGRYVVKENQHHGCQTRHRTPTQQLRRWGCRAPKQWCVKGWIIQPFYRRLTRKQGEFFSDRFGWFDSRLDLHSNNIGFDKKGRLVAFDW